MTQGNITKTDFRLTGDNPYVRLIIDGKSYSTFASYPSLPAFELLSEYNDPLRQPLVGGWIDFEHIEKPNRSGGEPWRNITSITALLPMDHSQIAAQPEEAAGDTPAPPNPYEYYDSMLPPPVYLNADRYIGANIAYDQYHVDKRFAMDKAIQIGGRDIFATYYKILEAIRDGDPRADGYTIGIEVPDVASGLNPVTAEKAKDEKTTEG